MPWPGRRFRRLGTADIPVPLRDPGGRGTPQDQAARPIEGDVGADNLWVAEMDGVAAEQLASLALLPQHAVVHPREDDERRAEERRNPKPTNSATRG